MSNYEWQKHYTRQRIESRLREAELHRLAAAAPAAPRRNPPAAVPRLIPRLVQALRSLPVPRLFPTEKQI